MILILSFVIGPVVQAATGIYTLPDGSARQQAQLTRATWMVLAGASLAMVAMRTTLGRAWREDLRGVDREPVDRRSFHAAVGVAAAGIVVLGVYLLLTGASSVSLEGRGATYTIVPHEGREAYLGLLAPIGLGGLLVVGAFALERRSRSLFAVAAAASLGVGALLALPGSRANLLYAIAPLFFLYVAYRKLPHWRRLLFAAVVLAVVMSYAAALRTADTRAALVRRPWQTLSENAPRPHRLERLFVVDVAHTEPLLGAMDAYPATRPFLGGESAALGFSGPAGWKFGRLIGLRFDPPAGVTFTAAAYGRDPSTFSGGLTATLPGELYANAGVPGVLLGLAAFGAAAGWVRRRAVSSRAAGSIALYAAAITILFAIFADYFGQFYRGGVIFVGTAIALIIGGNRGFVSKRAAVTLGLAVLSSGGLLLVRRFAGAPPEGLLTSFVPVYAAFAGLLLLLCLIGVRSYQHERG